LGCEGSSTLTARVDAYEIWRSGAKGVRRVLYNLYWFTGQRFQQDARPNGYNEDDCLAMGAGFGTWSIIEPPSSFPSIDVGQAMASLSS
jgi:hypothetical protein